MTDIKTWTAFAEKLLATGYSIFQTANVPVTESGASDTKVLALTLLARTISNLKGTLILLRERRIIEARTIARCCYENQYWIGGLVEEGDTFVRRMLHDEMKHRRVRGELILQSEAELEDEVEIKLRDWMRKANRDFANAKTLNPREVASRGPLSKSYIFYGQLSSDAAHPSVDALNRYVTSFQEDGEKIRGINVEPIVKDDEIISTLNLVCLAVIGVCVGANQIVGPTTGGENLDDIANEYTRLTNSTLA